MLRFKLPSQARRGTALAAVLRRSCSATFPATSNAWRGTALAAVLMLASSLASTGAALATASPVAAAASNCDQFDTQIRVVILLDTSGSLRQTDPNNRRLAGAFGAIEIIRRTAQDNPETDFYVTVDTFDTNYNKGSGWVLVPSRSTEQLDSAVAAAASAEGRDTDYREVFEGAVERFRESSGDGGGSCGFLFWFTDGDHDTNNTSGALSAAERQEIDDLCRIGGPVDELRQLGVDVTAIELRVDRVPSQTLRRLVGLSGECLGLRGEAGEVIDVGSAGELERKIQDAIPPVVDEDFPETTPTCENRQLGQCEFPFTLLDAYEWIKVYIDLTEINDPAALDVALRPPGGGESIPINFRESWLEIDETGMLGRIASPSRRVIWAHRLSEGWRGTTWGSGQPEHTWVVEFSGPEGEKAAAATTAEELPRSNARVEDLSFDGSTLTGVVNDLESLATDEILLVSARLVDADGGETSDLGRPEVVEDDGNFAFTGIVDGIIAAVEGGEYLSRNQTSDGKRVVPIEASLGKRVDYGEFNFWPIEGSSEVIEEIVFCFEPDRRISRELDAQGFNTLKFQVTVSPCARERVLGRPKVLGRPRVLGSDDENGSQFDAPVNWRCEVPAGAAGSDGVACPELLLRVEAQLNSQTWAFCFEFPDSPQPPLPQDSGDNPCVFSQQTDTGLSDGGQPSSGAQEPGDGQPGSGVPEPGDGQSGGGVPGSGGGLSDGGAQEPTDGQPGGGVPGSDGGQPGGGAQEPTDGQSGGGVPGSGDGQSGGGVPELDGGQLGSGVLEPDEGSDWTPFEGSNWIEVPVPGALPENTTISLGDTPFNPSGTLQFSAESGPLEGVLTVEEIFVTGAEGEPLDVQFPSWECRIPPADEGGSSESENRFICPELQVNVLSPTDETAELSVKASLKNAEEVSTPPLQANPQRSFGAVEVIGYIPKRMDVSLADPFDPEGSLVIEVDSGAAGRFVPEEVLVSLPDGEGFTVDIEDFECEVPAEREGFECPELVIEVLPESDTTADLTLKGAWSMSDENLEVPDSEEMEVTVADVELSVWDREVFVSILLILLAGLLVVLAGARVLSAWRRRRWAPLASPRTFSAEIRGVDGSVTSRDGRPLEINPSECGFAPELTMAADTAVVEGVKLTIGWLPLLMGKDLQIVAVSANGECEANEGSIVRSGRRAGHVGSSLAEGWVVETTGGRQRLICWDIPTSKADAQDRLRDVTEKVASKLAALKTASSPPEQESGRWEQPPASAAPTGGGSLPGGESSSPFDDFQSPGDFRPPSGR